MSKKTQNMKLTTAICAIALFATTAHSVEYSWNKQQATATEKGDLKWSPKPYKFTAGKSMRYIDFDGGSDSNAGTKSSPWKHHPWDEKAEAKSKAATGIHTYVFKCGVVYRGSLKAKESGEAGNPIRICSDPSWGKGDAIWQ